MVVKTDIEIAQACEKKKITEIAKTAGIPEAYLEQYGNYKAKVDYKLLLPGRVRPQPRWDSPMDYERSARTPL